MTKSEVKLPAVFIEIAWDEGKARKHGQINTQNLVLKAMSIVTDIVKKHGGKIVRTSDRQVFCTFPNTKKSIQAVINQQRAIAQEELLQVIETSLKIGLHYGETKLSKDDVSGEAASIAEKIKLVAQSGQILVSRDSVQEIPTALDIQFTKRGKLKVKGRILKIEVLEAIWKETSGTLTVYTDEIVKSPPSLDSVLVLKFKGKKYKLGKSRSSFLIGRSNENDIIIDETSISRQHASVKFKNGRFRLADQSKNGTYLKTESEEEHFLNQNDMLLEGKGVFCPGHKIENDYPYLVYYSVIDK